MIISILPARSGSKRIKNKNIKKFNGYPIIKYPITQIKKSKIFDDIFVSTDSKKIANLSNKLGAKTPFLRSKNLSNDHVGIIEVTNNYIRMLEKIGIKPDYICCVFPTAVFVKSSHLIKAFKILKKDKKIDYVFSSTKIERVFLRSFKLQKNNSVKMHFPSLYNSRSQDLESTYIDAGQFYFARRDTFLRKKMVFTPKSRIIDLSELKVVDINYLSDWKLAQKILNK